MPVTLDRAIINLAASVQDCMVSAFQLQTALINSPAKGSQRLIESVQHFRHSLHTAWDSLISFLQGCQGYGEDYISLCEYSVTRKPAETLAFASDVLVMAKTLSREATMLRVNQEKIMRDISMQMKKLPSMLLFKPHIPGNPRHPDPSDPIFIV